MGLRKTIDDDINVWLPEFAETQFPYIQTVVYLANAIAAAIYCHMLLGIELDMDEGD